MAEIELLEFGYSIEYGKHFIKFNIKELEEETKNKLSLILPSIPLEDIKRFIIESDDEKALKILEYFPEEEYPFNKEIPDEKEIKNIMEIVKGYLIRE